MAEREVVVDHARLSYEGLFSVPELYKLIDTWIRERGYDKLEKKNIEKIERDGKYIEIEILPWKKITDYAKNVLRLRIIMSNVKDVEIERDGKKIKLNQGKVKIVSDAYLETDYEHRWEGKPIFFFLRTVFDKYFFKPYTQSYRENVLKDYNDLIGQIKSFLNLYRYSAGREQTAPRGIKPDVTDKPDIDIDY